MMLERINAIALKFLEARTITETYELIAQEAMSFTDADYCSIYLLQNDELKKVYASHPKLLSVIAKKSGMTYKSYRTHKVYVVDSKKYWKVYPHLEKMKIKNSAFIPLSYHEKAIGVVVLQSLRKLQLSNDRIHELTLIGSMASLALRKTQLYEETARTTQALDYHKRMESVLESVYRAGLKFLAPLNLRQTYSTIIREALRLVDADIGSIFLKVGNKLERVYASTPAMYKIHPRKQGNLYKVFRSKDPIVLTYKQLEKAHPEMKKFNIRSNVLLPLINQDKIIGVLTLLSTKKDLFTKEDVNVLRLYSPLASLAIRKIQLYDEARKAIEVRDLFMSIAAHELRTPLTTLNGYTHLLAKKFESEKTQEARWIKNLSHEAHRLTHLVQDLLDVNKVQAGKLSYDWQECDVRELIQKAVINFKFSYPDTKIVFKDMLRQSNATIIGDRIKLLQVFNNILNNAGKFSPHKSKVVVTLSLSDDEYIVEFRDHGPGISKKDQKKIFNLFFKGNDNTKEGMGLGLYLAKSIVEKHKGTIELLSEAGEGTLITIRLPSAKL